MPAYFPADSHGSAWNTHTGRLETERWLNSWDTQWKRKPPNFFTFYLLWDENVHKIKVQSEAADVSVHVACSSPKDQSVFMVRQTVFVLVCSHSNQGWNTFHHVIHLLCCEGHMLQQQNEGTSLTWAGAEQSGRTLWFQFVVTGVVPSSSIAEPCVTAATHRLHPLC